MTATKPKRPVLRYHGGKWKLAQWIISHFQKHTIYVEPFGGAASVLLQKDRSYCEVYNDLDKEIVNLFRVLQDRFAADELKYKLRHTLYSREEFDLSYKFCDDSIEQARRTLVRSWMGIGTGSFSRAKRTGFRAGVKKRGTQPQRDWQNWQDHFESFIDRFAGVVIECQDYKKVIARNDTPDTLFYVDPPYPFETRNKSWKGQAYKYELKDSEHIELAEVLNNLKGMVILSGYACDLYDKNLFKDWHRESAAAVSDGGTKGMVSRTEVLWMNQNLIKRKKQLRLF